jgi:hypothetical protein
MRKVDKVWGGGDDIFYLFYFCFIFIHLILFYAFN